MDRLIHNKGLVAESNKVSSFPTYNKNSHKDAFNVLRKEVYQKLGDYKQAAHKKILLKGILLLSIFVETLIFYWVFATNSTLFLILAVALGILCLPLVLNIGHESVHGNFTDNKKINKLAKWAFFLLGTSDYFWGLRHNYAHHAYANIGDWDLDIEQSKIIRLSPQQNWEKRHQFQHWYMPVVFMFYTIVWFFYRDFKDITLHKFGKKTIPNHPKKEIIKLFAAKIVHLIFLVGIPYYLSKDMGLVMQAFFLFHFSASVLTTFALISTHVGETQEVVAIKDHKLPYSWFEHQFRTTADFSTNSHWMTHFFGGFNHHVAHHLFPNIPHIYYPSITPIIKRHAQENGIQYHDYTNLAQAALSHFKRLKKLSMKERDGLGMSSRTAVQGSSSQGAEGC